MTRRSHPRRRMSKLWILFLSGLALGMLITKFTAPASQAIEKRTVGFIDGRGQFHVLTQEESANR